MTGRNCAAHPPANQKRLRIHVSRLAAAQTSRAGQLTLEHCRHCHHILL